MVTNDRPNVRHALQHGMGCCCYRLNDGGGVMGSQFIVRCDERARNSSWACIRTGNKHQSLLIAGGHFYKTFDTEREAKLFMLAYSHPIEIIIDIWRYSGMYVVEVSLEKHLNGTFDDTDAPFVVSEDRAFYAFFNRDDAIMFKLTFGGE